MSLPARRPVVSEKIVLHNTKLHLSAGFDPATMELKEIWIRGATHVGSERDFLLDDLAVMLSLLLQAGLRPQDLRKKLPPSPVSLVGEIVNWLVAVDEA